MFTDARLTNFIANSLALIAVFAMLVGVVVWIAKRPYFMISQVQIQAQSSAELSFVSAASVQANLTGRLVGNFFFINLESARQLIETVPWVRSASIRRVWPNALSVHIEEQQPLALWNETQMINTWGEAFTANQGALPDDIELPHLNGPESSERLVVQRYAEIARWFTPLNLRIQEVTLSPRYAWEVRLSQDIYLNLGRDPAADVADPHGTAGALPFAARIQRFVQAWPVLAQRLEGRAISSADLRYPNGFAITLAPVSTSLVK